MNERLNQILDRLEQLVAFDSRNPPRDLTVGSPLFSWLTEQVPEFECTVLDYGDGCLGWYARRGETDTLFNVHLDTVPVAPGWTKDPFTLEKADDRAFGLGACDIKGAAACLLTLAQNDTSPMAILFTTDEEAGKSDAVRGYLSQKRDYARVIVAEPTVAKAVPGHRGIISVESRFEGRSGHASSGGVSAVHAAAKFIASSLEQNWAEEFRLNFGRIDGGVKPNMIAADCLLRFGFRGLPGTDVHGKLEQLKELAGPQLSSFEIRFEGPPLPLADEKMRTNQQHLTDWIIKQGLEVGEPVNFWTEASLFAAAGYPAIVLGPGDIAQAHAADEFVLYKDLLSAYAAYERIIQ